MRPGRCSGVTMSDWPGHTRITVPGAFDSRAPTISEHMELLGSLIEKSLSLDVLLPIDMG